MAKINDIRLKAKRYKAKPVCVTLHNGETYIGYIAEVNNGGVVLTGGGTVLGTPTTGGSSHRSKRNRKAVSGSNGGSSHKRKQGKGTRKPSTRSRQMSQAQVSSFLPMMGSLFGGLGGGAAAGGLLGGGMRLFGMIQQFVPVVKMGYGMIKSIKPFMGAVQGLMAGPSKAEQEEA
ncbi:hypothetical protein [Paenibacillus sp. 7516]|uniref:hypothetical protein n=1 Tax=Paenibacillus sp. 7516 TaxID=2022549 RepID=UPI000BA7BA12|nr:hypothetical protein [Paenibacillus sp. 7516]PAF33796.1 hypothetical protein CHI14_01390 [Paenibacillus sp. 7516]